MARYSDPSEWKVSEDEDQPDDAEDEKTLDMTRSAILEANMAALHDTEDVPHRRAVFKADIKDRGQWHSTQMDAVVKLINKHV